MKDRDYTTGQEAGEELRATLELAESTRRDPDPVRRTRVDDLLILAIAGGVGAAMGIVMLTGKPLFG